MNNTVRYALLFSLACAANAAITTTVHAEQRSAGQHASINELYKGFEKELLSLSEKIQAGVIKTVFSYERIRSVTVIKRMIDHGRKLRDAATADPAMYEQLARDTFGLHAGIADRASAMSSENVRDLRKVITMANSELQNLSSDTNRAQDPVHLSAMAINYGMMRVLQPDAFAKKHKGLPLGAWIGVGVGAVALIVGSALVLRPTADKSKMTNEQTKAVKAATLVLKAEGVVAQAPAEAVVGSGDGTTSSSSVTAPTHILTRDQGQAIAAAVNGLRGNPSDDALSTLQDVMVANTSCSGTQAQGLLAVNLRDMAEYVEQKDAITSSATSGGGGSVDSATVPLVPFTQDDNMEAALDAVGVLFGKDAAGVKDFVQGIAKLEDDASVASLSELAAERAEEEQAEATGDAGTADADDAGGAATDADTDADGAGGESDAGGNDDDDDGSGADGRTDGTEETKQD